MSYSSRATHPDDSSEIRDLTTSRTDEKGRQLIDEVTLARLIDECKEEQEQQQMIEMEHSNQDADSLHGGSSQASRHLAAFGAAQSTSELGQLQLARVD